MKTRKLLSRHVSYVTSKLCKRESTNKLSEKLEVRETGRSVPGQRLVKNGNKMGGKKL